MTANDIFVYLALTMVPIWFVSAFWGNIRQSDGKPHRLLIGISYVTMAIMATSIVGGIATAN